jgi:cobalt-zinc-cadmium efflux system protein
MSHDHAHGIGHSHAPDRSTPKRALKLALLLTGSFMVAEVVGGLLSGSLALLADAGHMLSDAASLAIALFAMWLAAKPATPRRSFGYQRAEILAALFNGLTLIAAAVWILYEAYHRLQDPPEVLGGPMLIVAVVGLLVNIAAAAVLFRSSGDSLNVSAAFRHVLADLAGSVGVIIAAVVVLTTGWEQADPIIGALIGVLVLGSAVPVIRQSLQVLLEQAPAALDVPSLREAILEVDGVENLHDLHVWTITSGFPALAVHILVAPERDCHERRREVERVLRERFEIEHTTIQVDHERPPELLEVELGPLATRGG